MMKLSIIICTRNRARAVIACLDSVLPAILRASPEDAEIIVVDNGSEDETAAALKQWAQHCPSPLHLLHVPKKGVSRARNLGVAKARGQLLAFIDDDCRLSEDYVIDLLRRDAVDSTLILRGGRVELGDPTDLPLTIKTVSEVVRWHKDNNSAKYAYLGGSIFGCNMTMRRALFDRLGLFDERFGPGTSIPGSEDTDYIFRAYLAGVVIEYVPDMTVYHHHGRKEVAVGRRLLCNYFTGTGALYAKYFFKDASLCRQCWWDIKKAVREIIAGRSHDLCAYRLTHTHKLAYCMLGAVKFIYSRIRTSMYLPPARSLSLIQEVPADAG